MNISIDLLGACLSIISSYFYIKGKPIAWLISLSAIPLDMAMDLKLGIYGDLSLQFVYCILLIYGWLQWRKGSTIECIFPIINLSFKQAIQLSCLTGIFIALAWLGLTRFFASKIALLDATVTILSILAQWMLSRKILSSWLLWIFVDVLYITLFLTAQAPFHAINALIDLIMCIIGYIAWSKEYLRNQESSAQEQLAHA